MSAVAQSGHFKGQWALHILFAKRVGGGRRLKQCTMTSSLAAPLTQQAVYFLLSAALLPRQQKFVAT